VCYIEKTLYCKGFTVVHRLFFFDINNFIKIRIGCTKKITENDKKKVYGKRAV